MDFQSILLVALQSDYFMSLLNIHGEDTTSFYLPKEMYPIFKKATDSMNLDVSYLQANDDLGFILRFNDNDSQDKFIERISAFNNLVRKNYQIPMPNIYAGSEKVNLDIVKTYLGEIREFFVNEYEGMVRIPISDSPNVNKFCTCTKNGIS